MLNESISIDFVEFSSSYDLFYYDCLRPYFIYVASYYISAFPFMVIDLMGCPQRFRKYKVQPTENLSVTVKQVTRGFLVVLFNFIFVGFPCECLMYYARIWRGCHNHAESQWPWFITIAFQLILMGILFQLIFFYCHIMLHSKLLYKHFHKMHHEWQAPISAASYYGHPVDHIFSNWLEVALPPLIIGADSVTITVWYTVVVFRIVCNHSGYKLPFGPEPEFHDYHHESFNKNFGSVEFLDKLHGTLAYQDKVKTS